MRPLFVLDIDATLADAAERFQAAGPEPTRESREAYIRWLELVQDRDRLLSDKAVPGMVALTWGLASAGTLLYLTSREERWREATLLWLQKHGFPSARIAMRAPDDWRGGGEFKRSMIEIYRKPGQTVVVLDDDPIGDIEKACKAAGYTFLKARSGGY